MGLLYADYWVRVSCNCLSNKTHLKSPLYLNGHPFGLNDTVHSFSSQLLTGVVTRIVAFASRKSAKKLKRNKEQQIEGISETSKNPIDDYNALQKSSPSGDDTIDDEFLSVVDGNSITIPSRNAVLKACGLTSGLMVVLGLTIRKVSQVSSSGGLPFFDCSEVSFGFEIWHLELITGLVVFISLSRYILLNVWPEFAESSEAANKQVLTSLEALDYVSVALLSGVGEELLFRGGLLPLAGLNWKGALAVAVLFGILHLGNGRKISFAVWATFVGLAYGYATIVSSSVVVPMASHALNNLVGALLWRFRSSSSNKTS